MEQISPKKDKEKEKLKENYTSEKTEDNNLSIDLENKIIKKNSSQKQKSQEEEKNPLNNSITDNQFTSDIKNSNKSNSYEKQDNSEEILMTISSNKKYKAKNNYTSTINKEFSKYYEKMLDYEEKRLAKIRKMREEKEIKEINKLKEKPDISKNSKILLNSANYTEGFYQRMKDEEKKTEHKKNELIKKIKAEREMKKKEQEKKPEYKLKKPKNDNKFNKFYSKMIEKDKIKKKKFEKFTEVVKDYEMRECVFQPNLTDFDENKYKNLNSNDLVNRLYNDDVKKRVQKKKELEAKFKPSFKPNITKTLQNFHKKEKIGKKQTELGDQLQKRFNNSAKKRTTRNYKLNEIDKNNKLNNTQNNLNNKIIENN